MATNHTILEGEANAVINFHFPDDMFEVKRYAWLVLSLVYSFSSAHTFHYH
jgi:hypothetical protein